MRQGSHSAGGKQEAWTDMPGGMPRLLLIIGTDASGKDHVARLALRHLRERGANLERRRGWLSAPACDAHSSEHKGPVRLLAERLFLRIHPLIGWAMAPALALCILADTRLFRTLRRRPALIVSHTALRLLAFHMGHDASFRMPDRLARAIEGMRDAGLVTLLVTSAAPLRLQRIEGRVRRDKVDNFDLYMASRPRLAEDIAAALERIAVLHLGAATIRNDAHGDEGILQELRRLWPGTD